MNISEIDNLEEELASKAEAVHEHPTSDITGLVEALAGKAEWDHQHDISDFPDFTDAIGNFAAKDHLHTISHITDLATALAEKANSTHSQSINSITGLTAALAGKAGTEHGHEIADVGGLQNALNDKSDNGHGHTIAQVTNLSDALNGKANASHFHEISQITGLEEALADNGNVQSNWTEGNDQSAAFIKNKPNLGTAASRDVGTGVDNVASGAHSHNASDITSGTISLARLPTIPGTTTIVSSGDLTALTTAQMDLIVSGSSVVTTDGTRYVYRGSGDKKLAANYIVTSTVGIDTAAIVGVIGFASTLEGGLMSAADKGKLDGVASGANNYVHPTGDGDLHVPATGVLNNGQVLTAGATAGAMSWEPLPPPYVHPTGDGDRHVPATGTTNNGKVLTAGPTAGSFSWQSLPNTATPATHTHGNLSNDGKLGDAAHRVVVTGTSGVVTQLSASGTSGQVLTSGGSVSAPSWGAANNHSHGGITSDGKVGAAANRVLLTGTDGVVGALSSSGTAGQVLTSNGTNAPTWQSPAAATSVLNLSGGTAGQLPFQSAVGTTSFVTAGTENQFLRSRGPNAVGPAWATLGSIVYKNSNEYVGTDTARSVLKIEKISQLEYDALATKEATTLYIIV
jgi:hypothetical protein